MIQGDRRISYDELLTNVRNLATALKQSGVQHSDRVAIAMERGVDAAQAIYAVLYLGACYVPLDLQNPGPRLTRIIDDAQVQKVVGTGACPTWLAVSDQWFDALGTETTPGACLKPSDTETEALAAILYTSGSTGRPKGVALSHRAMLAFADWAGDTFAVNPNDRIASLAPFHFDLSVFDLFTSLRFGATVDFVPAKLTMAPSKLSHWLDQRAISTWYTVPSLLGFWSFKGNLSESPFNHLRQILFAGEVFPTPRLIQLMDALPDVRFYNLYGPTETNVCCYWPVDRSNLETDRPIPIGEPACAADLRIDPANDELLVRGPALLSGYWNGDALMKVTEADGYYRTGDRVSTNESGEYLYHGRLDRMMKCSGYRVEPGEIEALVNSIDGVKDCAVTGILDPVSGKRPAAALVLEPNIDAAIINQQIRQHLPNYMQPVRYVTFKQLPRLSNGKLDYQSVQNSLETA